MIGECKECGFRAGIFGLTNGICAPCSEKKASDPDGKESDSAQKSGIGGWLLLPAIGFSLGPIVNIMGLIASVNMYSDIANAGFGEIYAFMIVVTFGLLVFQIYVAKLFFTKKSNAPSMIIKYLFINIAAIGIIIAVSLVAEAMPFAIEFGKTLLIAVTGAAIWVPYFNASKRVKATFTQ